MGLFKKSKPAATPIDYDSIDAVKVQTNLLVMTEAKDRQAAIKMLSVGSLVALKRTVSNGHNTYVVTDLKNGKIIGEISYGTSDYLAQNYGKCNMLGKVSEIGRLTPNGRGTQVKIEYKVYL